MKKKGLVKRGFMGFKNIKNNALNIKIIYTDLI